MPVKISMQVGPPMDWSQYGPEAADDPDIVGRCYDEITQRMQSALDDLAKEYPYPIVSRLQSLFNRT